VLHLGTMFGYPISGRAVVRSRSLAACVRRSQATFTVVGESAGSVRKLEAKAAASG
jgi:hypothetical protein